MWFFSLTHNSGSSIEPWILSISWLLNTYLPVIACKNFAQDWVHQHPDVEELWHRDLTVPWRFIDSPWVKGGTKIFCNVEETGEVQILLNYYATVNNNNEDYWVACKCICVCAHSLSHTQASHLHSHANTHPEAWNRRGGSWEVERD